jgi:uncharacterized protein (DUF1501 family)
MMRIGAGGLGFGLFGGIGPVPFVLSQASRDAARNTSGRILVVFEWFGGNDGLNTIVPYGDPVYYKHRPTIGIKEKDLLKIDAHVGRHPTAATSTDGLAAPRRRSIRQGPAKT